jgi:preprotein translocase subunit SecG
MIFVLLVIHIMVAIALIGVVLLQKSEGGALGIGGGGMSGFMTGRSTANLLTRATAILAAVFFTTSVLLVVMHNRVRAPVSIIDQGAPTAPARPVTPAAPTIPSAPAAPTGSTPAAPAKPAAPAVPAPATPSVPLAH